MNGSWPDPLAPGPELDTGVLVHIILLSVLCVAIFCLNACVILAIAKHRPLRTGNNLLILCLAVADICIAFFVIPGHITRNFSEEWLGNIMCIFCSYSTSTSMAAVVWSLSAISLVRVKAVAYPLQPKLCKRHAGFIITVIWLVALIYGIRGGMTYSLKPVTLTNGQNRSICTMSSSDVAVNKGVAALELVVIFILPALVVIVSYCALLILISRHNKRLKQFDINTSGSNNNNNNRIRRNNRSNMKAVRMCIVMVSIFIVCHLPTNVVMMHVSSGVELIPEIGLIVRVFYLILFLNSVLNPICYGFLNPKIRGGIRHVLCCCGQR